MANRRSQRGLTLIELLIAMTLAAVILAALDSVVVLGLNAQTSGRQANELVYQARFALDRMAAKARSTAPKVLTTPLPGATGDWFSPTLYCLKGGNQLVETSLVTDPGCAAGAVIANNVTAFSAQLPAGAGPVDDPAATLSLTLEAAGAPVVTLSTSVRLGGGAL
ncbi:MAG TPA: prepilin-type N-terminal cleavage/methylation domain-containing protein [Burkholderiales bacterium]|nr:prepilin-type N-terminal cleavage/methylation domain-containing protein [Burkholderiales bacterium]